MDIDDIRECIDRYEVIIQELSGQLSSLKRQTNKYKTTCSVSEKTMLIAVRLDDQIKKIISVTDCLKRYCDDCQSAEQEIVTEIKRKLFINDRASLLGKVIIESDIKRRKGSVLRSHVLIHDQWLDGMIIKNIAEDTDI